MDVAKKKKENSKVIVSYESLIFCLKLVFLTTYFEQFNILKISFYW